MLTLNSLIKHAQRGIPKPICKAMGTDFFIEILMEETLPAYSAYYPKTVKGIVVTRELEMKTTNFSNNVSGSAKYLIPMEDDTYPYQGIAVSQFPLNRVVGGTLNQPGLIDAFAAKIDGAMLRNQSRYVVSFQGPNIIEVSPPPKQHVDFTLSLHALRKLNEIKVGYHRYFKKLYVHDLRSAIYNALYEVAEGEGVYGGVNLSALVNVIQKYEGSEDIRDEILDKFKDDWWKDPERIDEIMQPTSGYA